MTKPRVIIIAGPNGAGKTTFAREFLPQEAECPIFVNADLIAAGLSPFDPERAAIQAGRLTLQAIAQHVARGESFAFETTLSGRAYARQIPQWQALGYRVELFFSACPRQTWRCNAWPSGCAKAATTSPRPPSAAVLKPGGGF